MHTTDFMHTLMVDNMVQSARQGVHALGAYS